MNYHWALMSCSKLISYIIELLSNILARKEDLEKHFILEIFSPFLLSFLSSSFYLKFCLPNP